MQFNVTYHQNPFQKQFQDVTQYAVKISLVITIILTKYVVGLLERLHTISWNRH